MDCCSIWVHNVSIEEFGHPLSVNEIFQVLPHIPCNGLPREIYASWSGGSSFSLISKSMLYRHKMSLFSQAKGPAQGPASSLRSIFTSALCLPVSTWLNSTGSTRIFLPDPGLLDNCHCCPGVCDRYGYYGSHQMKLSQFLFSWRIKSVLC